MSRTALRTIVVLSTTTLLACSPSSKAPAPVQSGVTPEAPRQLVAGTPITLEAASRAQRGFRVEAGRFLGGAPTHAIEVRADGAISFRPAHFPTVRRGVKPAVAKIGATVQLATVAVGKDGAATAQPRVADDGTLEIARGAAVERLKSSAAGLEQSWAFAERPSTSEDLVVRISLTGERYNGETAKGLHFIDPATGVGVRYGLATFVDANNARTTLAPKWDGRAIVIAVPASLIAQSAFPAVLDPTLGSEVGADNSATASESEVSVGSSGTNFLAAWLDGTTGNYRGRLISLTGTPLGADSFDLDTEGAGGNGPGVVFNGTNYLVTFKTNAEGTLRGVRVNPSTGAVGTPFDLDNDGIFKLAHPIGATNSNGRSLITWSQVGPQDGAWELWGLMVDPGDNAATVAPFVIDAGDGVNSVFGNAVAVNGTDFMVSYDFEFNNGPNPNFGSYVRPVTASGTVGAAVKLFAAASGDGLTIARGTTNYYATWADANGNVVGARVSNAGAFIDANPTTLYTNPGSAGARQLSLVWDGESWVSSFINGISGTNSLYVRQVLVDGSPNYTNNTGTGISFPTSGSDHAGHTMFAYSKFSDNLIHLVVFTNLGVQNGQPCGSNAQCASNFCVAGTCCNVACTGDANSTVSCTTGTCTVTACSNGFSDCDNSGANGCEANTTNNATGTNCGGCGAAFNCSTANASGATCVSGVCQPSCNSGFQHCSGNVLVTGCETSISTINDCGSCGATCTAAACVNPVCNASGPSFSCGGVPQIQCGTPNCGLGVCAGTDTDGDGLQDAWETQGYVDVNCNGKNDGEGIDVQLPGADVNVPDVYVELDYLEKAGSGAACTVDADCGAVKGEQCINNVCTHTHKPKSTSLDAVVQAVLRGENPTPGLPPLDASRRGFRLHLDATHMNSIDENATKGLVVSMGTSPGTRVLDTACVGATAANFFDLKDTNFFGGSSTAYRDARKRVYHYAIFGHYSSCPPGPLNNPEQFCSVCPADRSNASPLSGASGTSEKPGNDFIVSLGATYFDTGVPRSDINEGGTFLHELGHNLGLDHGVTLSGSTPIPAAGPLKSPNYLSIMNYNYQLSGVLYTSGASTVSKIDFADTRCTVDLNETALDENAGAGCGPSSPYLLRYFAVSGPAKIASGADGSPINWNGSTSPVIDSGTVPVDLNRNTVTNDIHRSLNDWAYAAGKFTNLVFDMGCLSWTLTDGLAPPEARSSNELTPAQAVQSGAATPPLTNVSVEVRPGCGTHWIALSSPATVPVAVYSSATFDATKLVPSSLAFAGESAASTSVGDVNGDGRPDLIASFVMSGLAIKAGATSAPFSGMLPDGTSVVVLASFTLVPSAGPIITPKADANGYSGTMWAANNQNQAWDLTACVTSATSQCGAPLSPLTNGQIVKITMDEKGNNQMSITGNASFSLAKARDGSGDGRVYTVYYTISDGLGNSTAATCKFEVRHDNPGVPAIDSGTKVCVGSCP